MPENNDYKVCIWGTTIPKHEANKIGIALIVCFIGVLISLFIFGIKNKIAMFIISLGLAVFGYCVVAQKVFGHRN